MPLALVLAVAGPAFADTIAESPGFPPSPLGPTGIAVIHVGTTYTAHAIQFAVPGDDYLAEAISIVASSEDPLDRFVFAIFTDSATCPA